MFVSLAMATLMAGCQSSPAAPGQGAAGAGALAGFLQIIYRGRGDALAHLGRYEEALAAYADASVAADRYPFGNIK